MRAYWTVEGFKERKFTALPAREIIDTKTGQRYPTSNMVFLKRSEAPKKLIEDEHKYDYVLLRDESHLEKKGLFRKITVVTKVYPTQDFQREDPCKSHGLWVIEGLTPTIYTNKACDFIRDRKTGKLYKRGEMVLFKKEEDYPDFNNSVAEYSGKFDIIYNTVFNQQYGSGEMSQTDYLRGIWANTHLK